MGTTAKAPWFPRWGKRVTMPLPRAGVKLAGPDHSPLSQLTVRGHTSGRSPPVLLVLLEQQGKRYLVTASGSVHGVRYLRARGVAPLTRGRCAETVSARAVPLGEVALVWRAETRRPPLACFMVGTGSGVTVDASLETFERAALTHPICVLERNEYGTF